MWWWTGWRSCGMRGVGVGGKKMKKKKLQEVRHDLWYLVFAWWDWCVRASELRMSPVSILGSIPEHLSLYFFIYLFFYYLWLCWVFVSVWGLSLVVASGGHSSSQCAGLSLWRPLLLRNTGSRRAGSVIVAHGLSCSAACGILPDQGSNPCPLHRQADSQPLRHQGSPLSVF